MGHESQHSWWRDFARFMWECKWWWIIPMVLMLGLFVFLIVSYSLAGNAPFRYTIF